MRQQKMTLSERADLLARHAVAHARQVDLIATVDRDPEHASPDILQELRHWGEEIDSLRGRYMADLPVVALSRSPWSGDVLEYAMDVSGLDGLWWDYGQPLRPLQQLPADFIGLAGALLPGAPTEKTPFEVRPGPEVPYVVPRLLALSGVCAVLSQIQIGPHTGYAVAYFADHPEQVSNRVNTWGTDFYEVIDGQGVLTWSFDGDVAALDRDFDLKPWMEAGKLLWIQPGDASMTLRPDVQACPFLALTGSHMDSTFFDGIRTEDEPDALAQEATEAALGQPVSADPVPDELWNLVMPT
ncbi:MAG TPA: hypothetical protein VN478_06240, partial [Clostridia bacterium]|nr:hypothetical protein [Clostridia bacterium]